MLEYTASGMPQQNGVADREFATLYNRMRVIMYSAEIDKTWDKRLGQSVHKHLHW